MKKQLLNLFILLCLMSTVSVFGQKAQSSITSTSSNLNYTPKSKGKGTQAVTSTTTSSCMSINLPAPATWSLVNYGTGTPIFADGFVNGPNTYGDKEKAMYFDASASANTMITQVYVGFDHAYSATPTKTVAIRIYDGTSLSPGTALGSGTLNMSTIMTDVANNQYSLLIFPTPINLPASKRFFVSVDVTGLQWTSTIHDSLSIVSNSDPQTVPTQVWEKWSTNAWVKYDNASSWQLDISLLIHPFLRQTPMTASISTTPSNTICAGKTINYNSAGSTTGGTFEWYFGSIPTPSATGATTMATYPAAGTFTTILLVEDACGSLKLTSNTITVLPNPTVTATPNSTTVCNGTNITLNGGGASTYAWTGGVTNNVAFTPSVTANYTVTGTAVNGCTAIAISAVVVNPNPVITVNSGSICSGQSFTMTPSGANTYTFSSGPVVSPTSNTSYSVTGTSAAGCISTSPAVSNVTVNANPTAILSSNSPVCANTAINLFANSVPGASYQWAGPNSYSSITQNPTIATASAIHAGIYSATVTSVAGCKGTSSVAVNVNPAPTASATSGGSITCVLTTQTLNGSGVSTYTWSGPGIVSGGNTANPTVNTPGTYTLIGSSSAGCVSAPVMIGVFSNTVAPTESITVSSGSVCPGNTSNLSVSGAYSYSWSTGSSSTSIVVSPTVGTTYSVLVTDLSNGCSITLNQAIGVYALPAVSASSASSLICGPPFQQTVTITASGASTYTWNTTAISNSISVSPSVTTQYTVTGTDANGCSNMTTFTQSVSACTGLEALGVQSSEIVVYPNPSNGNFTVKGLSNGMSVEIYNSIGQLIVKHETVSEIINVDGLSKGIYFVNVVENGKRIATKKVICE